MTNQSRCATLALIWIAGALLLAMRLAGCAPSHSVTALNSTPAPQQAIQPSAPVKVQMAKSEINLERLGHVTLAGNTLIASVTISNTNHWLSVDLDSGQVQGPQNLLRLDSTATASMRYIPHSTSYYDKKIQHQAGELFVLDLQQGKEFQVANNLPGAFPQISENIVIWQGWGDGGWSIYGYDITASHTITIADGPGIRTDPHISDNWVIYLDMGEEVVLHAYNIVTKEHLTLGPTAYPKYDYFKQGKYHLIGGGKAVWADAQTYDLHVYDLNTRTTEIVTGTVTACKPTYWLEAMAGHTLLYFGCKGWALYDLDSKTNVDIPAGGGWIVMSESRVVWQEGNQLFTARIER